MTCIQPGGVSAEDLIAYLAGEAPPSVDEHVRSCPECAAEARQYARSESRLGRLLKRFDCPSPQTIGEFQLDLLPPAERQRVAAHLVECPRCAQERRQLQDFLADEPAPVPGLLDRARRRVAQLIPPARQPALAMRGVSDLSTQTYQVDDFTITLRIEFDSRRKRGVLIGLVVPEEELLGEPLSGNATLVPVGGTSPIDTVAIDDTGFVIEEIVAGTYHLELTLEDQEVIVENLRVGL